MKTSTLLLFTALLVFCTGPNSTQGRTEGLVNVDITVSTSKLNETKQFYTKFLKFQVVKETPGFISFSPGPGVAYLDFVVEGAEHACARPQLAKNFSGKGMLLDYILGDVDAACAEFTQAGYPLAMPIKTESWRERHCYVIDPNGIPLNLAHFPDTPAEPTGGRHIHEILLDLVEYEITLIAANRTVEFRPFHPRNMTSFIPHLLEEFDGHGLSYTFNFDTSLEVDRWCQFLQDRNLTWTRPLGWVGGNRRCAVDDPNGVLINIATPGWNEYEEEVNCSQLFPDESSSNPPFSNATSSTPPFSNATSSPGNKGDPKGEGEIQRGCVITLITALVLSLLFPL